jgi:hypothetical protein
LTSGPQANEPVEAMTERRRNRAITRRSIRPRLKIAGGAIPANFLPSLLSIAEETLTVAHLATTELWMAIPSRSCRAVARDMSRRGFDAAPLRETPPVRFVAMADLVGRLGPVANAAQPIGIAHLVTSDLSLVDAVELLAGDPHFFFVLVANQLGGIVTVSDLQRPAVSMVAFSLVLAAETALNRIIEQHHGKDWITLLSDKHERQLRSVFDRHRRHNADLALLDCLTLDDRLHLIGLSDEARRALGLTSPLDLEERLHQLKHLRNTLAHGGGLLDVERDPNKAIVLFTEIRRFAQTAWRSAGLGG